MKFARVAPLPAILVSLFMTGCASRTYYASAPPPPPPYNSYQSAPPLIERAEHEGFRMGSESGARRNFHDTPGYDPAMGPYGPYRDAFRKSYLRGYDESYFRR